MSEQVYPERSREPARSAVIHRTVCWLFACLIFVSAGALAERLTKPVALDFPDFPFGVAVIDLGQRLTVNVDSRNDGGKGVIWSCAGTACTKLASTTKSATFHASGITGTAIITATSIEQPKVRKSLKVTVYLNALPEMLCDGDPLPAGTSTASRS
jgi:hypothetical protein